MSIPPVWLAVLWIGGSVDIPDATNQEILKRAEAAFQMGMDARGTSKESRYFQQAAEYYEALRQRGVSNAALFWNQGNANSLTGNWPQAILAYRRGLRWDPNNFQMRANLAYARDQVVYSSNDNFARPPESLWPPWAPRMSSHVAFWLTLIFYALAQLCLAMRWRIQEDRWSWTLWLGLAGAALFAIVYVGQARAERAEAEHPVVVIAADQTYLQKGNHSLYPPAYETPLNSGVEARLIQIRDNWLQIELAGGQVGWVARPNALVDLP